VSLEFRSGVVAQVQMDFVQDPPVHTLALLCEKGQARIDFLAGTFSWQPYGANAPVVETVPAGFDRNTMFVDEMRHCLDCVKQRTPALVPLAEGRAVLEIALKAKHDAAQR
jgi:predicted dehydrogenase